jgi:hypothetical protein
MLKTAYSFFIGILLAIFVGFGISAFYTQPKAPEYPNQVIQGKEMNEEEKEVERKFNIEQKEWDKKMKPYNRNVSIMTLVAATILVAISLLFEQRIKILSDGFMLGGIFTLLYSIGRSFAAQDSKLTFLTVSIGLVVAIALGYFRFIRPQTVPATKKKRK